MSLVLWPTEPEVRGFADLAAVQAHASVHARVMAALVNRVGSVSNSITNMAAIPASVLSRACSVARVAGQHGFGPHRQP